MIESTTGNLLRADADALVNTVNCVGVMGKGIALQFKQAFPDMFVSYRKAAAAGDVKPGSMHVYPTDALVGPKYIINFPTKRHWKGSSRLDDIRDGLVDLVRQVRELRIRSIAIPPLGSGNGGLDWRDVRPLVVEAFDALPEVAVKLFESTEEPIGVERVLPPSKEKLTTARALLLELLGLYQLPDYELTNLEVQKLAYFLQVGGQPLRLAFTKHHYGPYAHNLNHVLRRLEGHYLRGAIDVKPETEITLLDGALEAASQFLDGDAEARGRLAEVARLIEGFESPHGMELLATVHWVANEDPTSADDVERCIERVHAWSDRKKRIMKAEHVRVAHSALRQKGWLPSQAATGPSASA